MIRPGVYFASGIGACAIGILLVRLAAPLFAGPTRGWVTLTGTTLALVGLFVVALGMRNRIRLRLHQQAQASEPSPPSSETSSPDQPSR